MKIKRAIIQAQDGINFVRTFVNDAGCGNFSLLSLSVDSGNQRAIDRPVRSYTDGSTEGLN